MKELSIADVDAQIVKLEAQETLSIREEFYLKCLHGLFQYMIADNLRSSAMDGDNDVSIFSATGFDNTPQQYGSLAAKPE